jgi:hypothetical protein
MDRQTDIQSDSKKDTVAMLRIKFEDWKWIIPFGMSGSVVLSRANHM